MSDPTLRPLLVAFSGGGDSTALLLRALAQGPPVWAVIVDHATRPGSAADSERAAQRAEALGARVDVRRLSWPNGRVPGHQGLRAARYRALAEACHAHGADAVQLGHTADDQAETTLIRLARGSRWRGLAAMAEASPFPLWPEGRGLSVSRPLLQVSRAALRHELIAKSAQWLEDPANAAPRFDRARARARIAAEGLGPALLEVAAAAGRLAAAWDAQAAALLRDHAIVTERGQLRIDRAAFEAAPPAARRRALNVSIAAASGSAREPQAALLDRWEAARPEAATLSGAFVRVGERAVTIGRDPGFARRGANAPSVSLGLGPQVIDGRFLAEPPGPGWRIGFVGRWADLAATAPNGAAAPIAAVGRWLLAERIGFLLWRGGAWR